MLLTLTLKDRAPKSGFRLQREKCEEGLETLQAQALPQTF